jgi:uncharacterized protein (DUF2345 family)
LCIKKNGEVDVTAKGKIVLNASGNVVVKGGKIGLN